MPRLPPLHDAGLRPAGTEHIFETMRDNGFTPVSVTVAGGATRSDLWLQTHADVSNVPFILTKVCPPRPPAGRPWRSAAAVAGPAWQGGAGAAGGTTLCALPRLAASCSYSCGCLSGEFGCPVQIVHHFALPPKPPPALPTQVADAPALGCAILAAVAAGLHPDVSSACAAMVHQARSAAISARPAALPWTCTHHAFRRAVDGAQFPAASCR